MKNHTELETVAEYVVLVVSIFGVVAVFQLHQWWGWVLFVIGFVVGAAVYRRANNRAGRPPAA